MELCRQANNVMIGIKTIMMDAHNSAKSSQVMFVDYFLVIQNVKRNCKIPVEMVSYKLIWTKNVMMVIMLILMVAISSVRLNLLGNALL